MDIKTFATDKLVPFFKKNYGYFFIPLFVIVVFLIAQASFGIYPFGTAVMSSYDMLAQENPILEHFFSVFKGESGLFHTFYIGGGMDMFGSLAYCTISPFSFIFLLGGEGRSFLMVSYVLPLKVACSGIAAFWFVKRYFKTIPDYLAVVMGLLYAYGGYLYVANTYIVWLDISIYMPFMVAGFMTLIKKNDLRLFVAGLACMIYACFSIACFSFFLLFPILTAYIIFCVPNGERKRKLTRMCFGFVLAVAIALPLMLPALYAYTKAGRNTGIFVEVFKVLTKSSVDKGDLVEHLYKKFTYIFCNSTFIFLGAYYFVCSKKGDKFALFSLVAFLILILPCLVDESMKLLNMGSYMSYSLRFGFLLDCFALIVAAKGLEMIIEKRKAIEEESDEKPQPAEANAEGGETVKAVDKKAKTKVYIGSAFICILVCAGVFFTFRFFNFIYDGEYKTSPLVSAFMKWTSMSESNMPFGYFFSNFAHSVGGLEATIILFFVVTIIFVITLILVKYLNVKFKDIACVLCVLSLSQTVFFNFSLVKGNRQSGQMEQYSAYSEIVNGVNEKYGENYYRYKNFQYYISSDSPLVHHGYSHSLFSSMADAKNLTVQQKFGYRGNGQNSTKSCFYDEDEADTDSKKISAVTGVFSNAVVGYKYIVYNLYDGDEINAKNQSYYKNAGIYGFEKPCAEMVVNSGNGGKRVYSVDEPKGDYEGVVPKTDIVVSIKAENGGYGCYINGKLFYFADLSAKVKTVRVVGHRINADLNGLTLNGEDKMNDVESDKWTKSGSDYKVSGQSSAYIVFDTTDFGSAEATFNYGKSSGGSNAYVALRVHLEDGKDITVQINTPKFVVYENENVLPMCAVVDGCELKIPGETNYRTKSEVAVYDFLSGSVSGKSKITASDIPELKAKLDENAVDYKLARNEIIIPEFTAKKGQYLYLNYVNIEGYDVRVNGKKTEFIENDMDFMIIELEEGVNKVTIKYKSPYYKYILFGIIAGGLIVGLYMALKKKMPFVLEKAEIVIPYMAYALATALVAFFLIFPTVVFLCKFFFKYLKMIISK